MADDKQSFSPARKWSIAFNVVLRSAVVLAVLVMVNYIGAEYFERYYLSSRTRVEVSPRTVSILKSVTNDVNVILYYDKEDSLYSTISALLDEYHAVNPRVKIRTVDYVRNPADAQLVKNKYQLSSTADQHEKDVVIFDCEGHIKIADSRALAQYSFEQSATSESGKPLFDSKLIAFNAEMIFTSMLMAVISPEPLKAYYLVGHGEHPLDGSDELAGYLEFLNVLAQNYIKVEPISLLGTNTVPDDCNLLVIAGPMTEIYDSELEKVQNYLEQGGRLFALLNSFSKDKVAGLTKLLARWNVIVGDNAVVDMENGRTLTGSDILVNTFRKHPIINPLLGTRLQIIMPRWVGAKETPNAPADAPNAEAIAYTGDHATLSGEINPQPKRYPLIVAVEKGAVRGVSTDHGATRIVVTGDSYFLGNKFIASAANRNFAEFAINWLVERPYLLEGLGPRPVTEFRLNMSNSQFKAVQWILLAAMPGAFLLVGGLVWLRRRK